MALLEVGARSFPTQMRAKAWDSDFVAEVQFGLQWLEEMWNDSTKTLYSQVGIGGGNSRTISDHDIWRLPQADDTYGGTDPADRYIRNRPVFEGARPGSPVSPNLAGRLAADFGLYAVTLFAASDRGFAATCLRDGEDVYRLADTAPPERLLTTAPYSFYPETQWRDDMELGDTELASAVGPGPQQAYLRRAALWAASYLASPDQGTLNRYNVWGLAHFELARLIPAVGARGLAVTTTALENQIRSQLEGAIGVGTKDPFTFGYPWSSSDTVSHGAGLAGT